MGVVFEAEQSAPVRRRVALKVIRPGMASDAVVARFEAERQALALMDHPNIAAVHDAGTTDSGRPYFVMELVDGAPITDYCDRARLTPRQRLELFLPVCAAVQHAHQKGVIHRDLKPSNVLVAEVDGKPVPKVIDFGVAKAVDQHQAERTLFTRLGAVVGTPEYMSPEQAGAGPDVDTRTDVYGLGVLLYELLTGTTPLDRETLRRAALDEVLRRVREEEPPKPSCRLSPTDDRLLSVAAVRGTEPARLSRLVRGDLDWVVMRALEKQRARRYETAAALARDVRRHLEGDPVEAGPPSAWYRLSKAARRHRVGLATSALVALSLVLGTAVSTWQAVRAARSERAALGAEAASRRERDRALKAEGRATEAARAAQTEAAIAEAISDFLQNDLLAEARPQRNARGRQVTVEAVLNQAAARIAGRFEGQPEVEAAIRLTIGDKYKELGLYQEGQTHLERALELRRRVNGPEHPKTLEAMIYLALLYDYQGGGQPEKGDSLLVQALEASRRVNGPEHPTTLMATHNLAALYARRGQNEKAGSMLAEALEAERRVLGPTHRGTLTTMANLANTYLNRGQHEKAEALLEEVLEAERRVLGPEHPGTQVTMNSLALAYEARGRSEKAEALLERALEAERRVLGPTHQRTLVVTFNLALLYSDHGKPSKAEPLLAHLVEVVPGRTADVPDWLLPNGWLYMAKNRLLQGRYAEGEAAAREAVKVFEHANLKTWDAWEASSVLGDSLLDQKRYAEAEPFLLSGYEGMKAQESTIPPRKRYRLLQAGERVVRLYEASGKPEQVKAWKAKLGLADLPDDVFAPP
jgi:tetratricopeptide (TPR) repeat protein